eukprot:2738767-Lingulodinium_polyedra.AAC.1
MTTSAYLLSRTAWHKYSPEDEFIRCIGAKHTFQCCMPERAICSAKLSETRSTGATSCVPGT